MTVDFPQLLGGVSRMLEDSKAVPVGLQQLTDPEAGVLIWISQPEVSRLFKATSANIPWIAPDVLTGFDRDVEIVVRPQQVLWGIL